MTLETYVKKCWQALNTHVMKGECGCYQSENKDIHLLDTCPIGTKLNMEYEKATKLLGEHKK